MRHVQKFSSFITKQTIKEAMILQNLDYDNPEHLQKYRVSIFLNNAFNFLNENEPIEAMKCVHQIRKFSSKKIIFFKIF